jgi:phage gp45-like
MHRATPANTSFRAYVAGGARTVIHQADDSKLMQEMGGNFAKGESRGKVESPQNYGFTSVVMDADKGQDGSVSGGAEGFMQFPGGNRSFAVCGVMDDRRHRLKGLEKGDVAMFRTKDDGLQMHMSQDGGFFTGPNDKNVRMQLVQKPQQQQQGGQGQQPAQRDASGGSSGGGSSSQQGSGKPTGQKPVYKNGQDSDFFFHLDQTNGAIASGINVYLRQGSSFGSDQSSSGGGSSSRDTSGGGSSSSGQGQGFKPKTDNVKVHVADDGNVYLGGKKGDSGMLRVLLEGELISQNVYAKSGGGSQPDLARRSELQLQLLPIVMLLLGISLGANYALATNAWNRAVVACSLMIASR